MALPKVSIVIPGYKPGHFEQCLRSAIGQTYANIEILVSDNCPSDAIKDICAKFPGVIYQRNSSTGTRNVLESFYMGRGEFIKPLFDDDLLHPFCVERMVAAMATRPEVDMAFSASQVINFDNERKEVRRPFTASGTMRGVDLQRTLALGLCNIVGEFSTIMIRRSKLWDIGWKDLFVIAGHDFTNGLADVAAYCKLTNASSAFYIDEELSYFRTDQRLQSNSNPMSNPNFGYCFSDYIDLLVASHRDAVITTEELVGRQDTVAEVTGRLGGYFAQVGEAQGRYLDYIGTLQHEQA